MPNPKLETYKNKATGTVYDYTDAAAQAALEGILDGTDIDSFGDVETALDGKVDKVTGKGLSTNDYDDTEKAKVAGAFPRSEQAVLGAKNINGTKYVSQTSSSVVWTANDDGSITAVSGRATGNNGEIGAGINNAFVAPFTAQVKILGGLTSSIFLYPYDYTDGARPYKDATKTTRLTLTDNQWGDTPLEFYMIEGHKYVIAGRVVTNATANNDTMYPRLLLASDTDTSFSAHTMTNKELTDAVAVKNGLSSVTVIEGATLSTNDSFLRKQNNVISAQLRVNGVTANSGANIATIPSGFIPSLTGGTVVFMSNASTGEMIPAYITINGYVRARTNLSAVDVNINFTYIAP